MGMKLSHFNIKQWCISMFEHELGQVVQVTISGEEGHIKGRAQYPWFEEGELSPVALQH